MQILKRGVNLIAHAEVQGKILSGFPCVLCIHVVLISSKVLDAPALLVIGIRQSQKKVSARVAGGVRIGSPESEVAAVKRLVGVVHLIATSIKPELQRMR